MILLIDNYDSFAHNLARYLRELGQAVTVRRNNRTSIDEIVSWVSSITAESYWSRFSTVVALPWRRRCLAQCNKPLR